jgi:hypothetical protein
VSQENVEVYRRYIDDFLALREFDAEVAVSNMAEYWDPEIEQDATASPALDAAGFYRGIDAVRRSWLEWFGAWETLHFEYELIDAGDRAVLLPLDLRMRGRSTGIEVTFGEHALVTTFRAGLMVHNKLYMSKSDALKAIGLEE